MAQSKITEINATLWGKQKVSFAPYPDVNIIVGINGSGKTTLLSEIESSITKNIEDKSHCIYIPSIDNIALRDKRKVVNALTQDLDYYIYDMKTGPSLMHYRMSMIDAPQSEQTKTRRRISDFCDIVNTLFNDTGKHIEIDGTKFLIISNNEVLPLEALSSGEKQLLLILLRVFLLPEDNSFVLIDEPENSLDISWQYKLIDILIRLSPNAQFFITTHSPSIFGNGWGNKIFYMEDVTSNIIPKE